MLGVGDLDFWYRADRPVLRSVAAHAPAGRITVILGPNGAGKSTLLRLMAGLARPKRGWARLDGRDLTSMPPRAIASRMAYIPQHTSLAFPFTVRQFIRLGLHTFGGPDSLIVSAAETAGVADRLDDALVTLSAGQRQRASFARALAQCRAMPRPGAIVADEPTSAMDPLHALESLDALRDQTEAGFAVVTAIHDLSLAIRYADTAVVLTEHGSVAAAGDAGKVLVPEVLEPVFGLRFESIRLSDGLRAVVPRRLG